MVGQLPPAVVTPTGAEEIICYVGGVPQTITPDQIADTGTTSTYLLQWAVWFNGAPGASELLALYVPPTSYVYPANFVGSVSAPPVVNPAAAFVLDVDIQFGGTGAWATIGTISVSTAGVVTFATTGEAAISVTGGDRLRVIGPMAADANITGFAATLKGSPSS